MILSHSNDANLDVQWANHETIEFADEGFIWDEPAGYAFGPIFYPKGEGYYAMMGFSWSIPMESLWGSAPIGLDSATGLTS